RCDFAPPARRLAGEWRLEARWPHRKPIERPKRRRQALLRRWTEQDLRTIGSEATTSRLAIDHPTDSANIANCRGTELLAKSVNQELDGVALDFLVPAVNVLLELLPGQDGAGPCHKRMQKRVFACGQAAGLAICGRLISGRIETDNAV